MPHIARKCLINVYTCYQSKIIVENEGLFSIWETKNRERAGDKTVQRKELVIMPCNGKRDFGEFACMR